LQSKSHKQILLLFSKNVKTAAHQVLSRDSQQYFKIIYTMKLTNVYTSTGLNYPM